MHKSIKHTRNAQKHKTRTCTKAQNTHLYTHTHTCTKAQNTHSHVYTHTHAQKHKTHTHTHTHTHTTHTDHLHGQALLPSRAYDAHPACALRRHRAAGRAQLHRWRPLHHPHTHPSTLFNSRGTNRNLWQCSSTTTTTTTTTASDCAAPTAASASAAAATTGLTAWAK